MTASAMRSLDTSAYDQVIEWLLGVLLVFAPLAFGAVEAWSEEVVICLAAALSICLLLKTRTTGRRCLTWTWGYIPILIFLVIPVAQLMPIPSPWSGFVSPHTVSVKTDLLGDLSNSQQVLAHTTLSFYPRSTQHDLRLVLAVVAVFVVVLNVYRRPEQIMRLLGVIAATGAGVAILALAQDVIGNDKIYWLVPAPEGAARSGPFANHNHYVQYVNLSMGAILGLVFVRLQEDFVHCRTQLSTIVDYLASPGARVIWAASLIVVLATATVFLSMSRSGMVSTLVAGTFLVLLLSLHRRTRGANWVMILVTLAALTCVLYTGFDAVYGRLSALRGPRVAEGGRWQIIKNTTAAWAQFPLLGTGLGTHEAVYPMFARLAVPELATHAENEYVQTLEETGIVGLFTLIVFGGAVGVHGARAIHFSNLPICLVAHGLVFGLTAVLVHSLSDFGQHVPANTILSAIFCALLIRLSYDASGIPVVDKPAITRRHSRWLWPIAGGLLCLIWGWVLLQADANRKGEAHWRKVLAAERNLSGKNWQGSDEEYAYLIRHAAKSVDCEPANIEYKYWLNVYRWHAISRTTDPNTGMSVMSDEALGFAKRIAGELNDARVLCPSFGATLCFLGQLERAVLGRGEDGARHIRAGSRLAPFDATSCLVLGTLHAEEGDPEAAFRDWRRAVRLDEDLYREAALLCIKSLGRPERALELVEGNTDRLIWLASALDAIHVDPELTKRTQEKISDLLEQKCREPQVPPEVFACLAAIRQRQGRLSEAVGLYRQALGSNLGRSDWHLGLATVLVATGSTLEAMEEAKACLRLQPQYPAARRFLESLSSGAGSLPQESRSSKHDGRSVSHMLLP